MEPQHCLSRLRRPVVLSALLLATAFASHAADDRLRKPVGKGVYEMAYSQESNALWVATSQSRSQDKGGVIYRLDPDTLDVNLRIFNDYKPFGAAIDRKHNTVWFGNTVNSTVTALDDKTGELKGRVVLDPRKRTDSVRPLQPRELAVNEDTNTVYITGIGQQSVIWVVDGNTVTLKTTIENTGKLSTGLAIDSAAKRLYSTNADGELLTTDTATNTILSRKMLLNDGKEHFFLNLSLDIARQCAFITDSKQPQMLVVNLKNGEIISKVDVPESLAVLFNPARDEAYVTHRQAGTVSVVDGKTYIVVRTFDTPPHPNSLVLSPDGSTLYISVKQPSSRQKEASEPDDVIRIKL